MTFRITLVITALFVCHLLFGQAGASFLRLGVNEGLSQNSVREIFQDRQGFIWIGTGDGLNRYDGIQIKKYRQSFRDISSRRFPGKILNGRIHQDADGNLWMMVDGKLVKMDVATETFEVIKPIGGDLEHLIIGMHGNKVYIVSQNSVDVVNIEDRSVVRIEQPEVFGFYQLNSKEASLLYKKGNNIFQLDPASGTHKLLFSTGNDSLYAASLSDSRILFAAGNKISEYDLLTGRVAKDYSLPDNLYGRILSPLLKARNGDIILAFPGNGIIRIDSVKSMFHHYVNIENDPFSLSSNLVYMAIIDKSDNMWLGTEGGGISHLSLRARLF
ncbi:MAG: hypothetical protein J7527_08435, partial [Chitinophagaceae bacterium]|nr:hypothetical protein [Chitinophagaceae bacterium]